MKKLIFIMILVTSFATFADDAKAPSPNKRNEGLNLSEDQQKKISESSSKSRDKIQKLKNEIDQIQESLDAGLEKNLPEKELKKILKKMLTKYNEFATARFEQFLSTRSVLTPEQRKHQKFRLGQSGGKRGERGQNFQKEKTE